MFGHNYFFSGQFSTYAAKSINTVTLVYIEKKDFLDKLSHHKKDQEMFYYIKDNVNIYKSLRIINMFCSSCNSFNH